MGLFRGLSAKNSLRKKGRRSKDIVQAEQPPTPAVQTQQQEQSFRPQPAVSQAYLYSDNDGRKTPTQTTRFQDAGSVYASGAPSRTASLLYAPEGGRPHVPNSCRPSSANRSHFQSHRQSWSGQNVGMDNLEARSLSMTSTNPPWQPTRTNLQSLPPSRPNSLAPKLDSYEQRFTLQQNARSTTTHANLAFSSQRLRGAINLSPRPLSQTTITPPSTSPYHSIAERPPRSRGSTLVSFPSRSLDRVHEIEPMRAPSLPILFEVSFSQLNCYHGHKNLRRVQNTHHSLPCMICEHFDSKDRYSCTWCSIRMCSSCASALKNKCGQDRDLRKLMQLRGVEHRLSRLTILEAANSPAVDSGAEFDADGGGFDGEHANSSSAATLSEQHQHARGPEFEYFAADTPLVTPTPSLMLKFPVTEVAPVNDYFQQQITQGPGQYYPGRNTSLAQGPIGHGALKESYDDSLRPPTRAPSIMTQMSTKTSRWSWKKMVKGGK